MPIYSSSDMENSHDPNSPSAKFFGREKPLYYVLGGGQVADLLLWRNKTLSAAVLAAVTMIWFLFEVVEYNLVSLVCHIIILVMLMVFITCTVAKFSFITYIVVKFADWDLPDFLSGIFRWLYRKINWVLPRFYEISSGENFMEFFLVIAGLWMTSVIGNYFSSLNLLFFGALCLGTLPALYEQYETEVNHLILKGSINARKVYWAGRLLLNKIPSGRVKEKKRK